jgi:predicted phage-related endonuclease
MNQAAPIAQEVPYIVVCDSKNEAIWKAARNSHVGASESAIVLGAAPESWKSLIELWGVKTGAVTEDRDAFDNEAMFWGHELEESIVHGYAKRTGRTVVPFGLMLASTRYPWMSATPDALTTDNPEAARRALVVTRTIGHLKTALKKKADASNLVLSLMAATQGWWPLQIKNLGLHSASHWENGIPLYYTIQCTHEAIVFGSDRTTGAALVAGQRLAWDDVPVALDGLLPRQVVNLTRGFWERNVRGGVRPPPDGSDSARRTLEQLYPREKPETVLRLDADMLAMAEERDALKARVSTAEKRLKEIDNAVREAMGDAESGMLPDGSGFTLKTVVMPEFVTAAKSYRKLHRKKANG